MTLAIKHLLQTENLRYEKLTQTHACPWLGVGQSLLTPWQAPSTVGPMQPAEDIGPSRTEVTAS